MDDPLAFPTVTPLDRRNGPLYRQLARSLRDAIARGAVEVGDELPTEARLAEHFSVSLITVRQALRDLAQDGLIRKRAAKAAIVAQPPAPRPTVRLNSLADIVASTTDVGLEIASWRPERLRLAAETFHLPVEIACPCLRGRLLHGASPVAAVAIYFPPRIGAQLRRADFDDVVVFRSVQRRLGLRYTGGRLTVRAALADARSAEALDCRPGAALLIHEYTYFGADGEPVELTIARHRGDAHSVTYDLTVD